MITQSSIEQLMNMVAIEDIVGDYVNIKRSGSRYKGNCPFHDEKTASFIVTPSLGIYKCFGCQNAGNAIGFLMAIEQYSFVEAVRAIASRYNFELEETFEGTKEEFEEKKEKRQNQQVAMEFALKFFIENLQEHAEGKAIGLSYFKERGFSTATINKWKLGFALDSWDALYTKTKTQKYDLDVFADVGLLRKKDNGDYYDWYRNRVMFPIHSVSGNIIAFAGRILGNKTDKEPKYVNSPETELYHKSDVLFGMYEAKNTIKKYDKVYLVEGYTDVISLAQAGVENVVASSGTALTDGQIRLIKRFTDNITVLYDGDAAGQKASMRGIDLILESGMNVRIVGFPLGEDPDSYCQKLGPEGFADFLKTNEQNFIYYKARTLFTEEVERDPIRKAEEIKDILNSVAKIPDAIKRNALLFELSRICAMDEQLLASELSKILRKARRNNEDPAEAAIKDQLVKITQESQVLMPDLAVTTEPQEKMLFKLLLHHAHKPFIDDISVFHFMIQELSHDIKMPYDNKAVGMIFNEIEQMDVPTWPGQKYYLNHVNNQIASLAIDLVETNYALSNTFAENDIYVLPESKNYKHDIQNAIIHYRLRKLMRIREMRHKTLKEVQDNMLANTQDQNMADIENKIEHMLTEISMLDEMEKRISEVKKISLIRNLK